MLASSRKTLFKRSQQLNDSYCGPAVIEMLLANVGVCVTQTQISEAGNAASKIDSHGMTVPELAMAVNRLSAGTRFWVKEQSSMADIDSLINTLHIPLAVEWQGLFDVESDTLKTDEDSVSDYGHYSIVTTYDVEKQQLIIVDPYKDFIEQDRIFAVADFLPRWWDTNIMVDEISGKEYVAKDEALLFCVTKADVSIPKWLKGHFLP